ncbi:MAG: glycosyltransferase family 4 protein [Salinivenus sp.]
MSRSPSSSSPAAPRVLFVDQSGRLGGAELYLLDVARLYRETSRVVLFEEGPFADALRTADISTTILEPPAAVRRVRKQDGLWALLQALPGLARTVIRLSRLARDYDLLFANTQKALLVAGLAGWWAGRPVVWNLHDLLTEAHFARLNRWAAVWGANALATHVIANSKASQQAFEAAGGRVPTSVVYNGIDPTPFETVPSSDVAALRTELGVEDAPLIGLFGRLAEWKGQHVLIEALSSLPAAHALLVGDALFDGDQAYARRLRQRVGELGLADRVHFLGFRDDVPALMTACDVVVHTSVAPEPFGRVIVEGMLAGCPVVATNAGGALEIVEDGRTGRLVPPADPTALTQALSALLQNADLASSLATAGRARAQALFSPRAMHSGVHAVLSRALCLHGSRRPPF